MKVFLSYSFDPVDAKVANHFVDLFHTCVPSAEIITAKEPKAIAIAKKIDNAIDICDCVLVILTKKYKLSKGDFMPPPWCLSEIGIAQGKGKPYFGFVESNNGKGIDLKKLGSATEIELLPFSRNALPVREVDEYIRSQVKNTGLLTAGSYEFDFYENHIVIFKNGHGIASNRIKLKNFKDLDSIRHLIGLGGAPKNSEFTGGLKALIKTPIEERFSKQHLCARIIENKTSIKDLDISIKPNDPEEPRKIPFLVHFNKLIPKNSSLIYSYGWGSPEMHYVTNKHRLSEHGPLPNSILTARHPIRKIIKQISFENGIELKHAPKMVVKDLNGVTIDSKDFIHRTDMYYNRYSVIIDSVTTNAQYIAEWQLK